MTERNDFVGVFNSSTGRFPGGVFQSYDLADEWIAKHKLTGVLTKYPVDIGCLDWAMKEDLVNMSPLKLEIKAKDPNFIGSFTTASQDHVHFENGRSD